MLDKLRLLMKIMQYDWKLQNSYYSGLTLRWGRQNQHSLSKLVIKTTTKAFISACSYKLLLNQLLYMCHPSHYIKVKQHVKIKPLLPIKQKKTPMLPLIPCASFFFSLLLKFTSDRYSERFCFERTDLSSLFNKIYVYFRSSTKHLLIEERPGPEGSIKHFMTIKTIQAEKRANNNVTCGWTQMSRDYLSKNKERCPFIE